MSVLLVAALNITGTVLPACSWDRPGVNPFQGDVVAAVDRYQDIPAAVRETLKKRMVARKYDEIATIRRDEILGAHRYTELRDMHFGKGQICRTVTREKWAPKVQERGLVYCEEGHCIIVPTVCRNVSRVTRLPLQPTSQLDEPTGAGLDDRKKPLTASADAIPPGNGELQFDAPAAGGSPSFSSGLSGSSPVLPGGSDSGLASGIADPNTPFTSYNPGSPFTGLPFIVASSLPPTSAGSPTTGNPGVPGAPGTPGTIITPTGPFVPGSPTSPDLNVTPPFPGTTPTTPTIPGLNPDGTVPAIPGVTPGITTPIPEPSTYALMGLGLGVVLWMGRRRARREGAAA